jgi:UDP-N-acetylglucosamine acyltransferase
MESTISPLAHISKGAQIGEGVIVEPFAYIAEDTVIGDGSWIGPHASIMKGGRIGRDCKIFPGAVIAGLPQDLKYAGEQTTAEVGDRTVVRECVTINLGTADRRKTAVGKDCLLMAYTHIAHDALIGDHVIIANSGSIAGHVTVEDWVIIEGMVGVQQFVHIGQHVFVAGGSLIRKNIPPYVKAAREPLSYIGVNAIGLRRRGFDNDRVLRIEDIYRMLYIQNGNMAHAIKVADAELPACEDKEIVLDFIRASGKGIIRGPF